MMKQHLLYLHAQTPNLFSDLHGETRILPKTGFRVEIPTVEPQFKYGCVHDAISDGWRVVHFPNQRDPIDDKESDILGYEFILEKLVSDENE